jgi:hypothetical protein
MNQKNKSISQKFTDLEVFVVQNNMSEDFSILMGVLAPIFKAHVQGNRGKLILIPSRGD